MSNPSDEMSAPSNQADYLRELSNMLRQRGLYPGKKMYSKVTPKGLYKFLPSMWRKAKLIGQVNDYSYEQLMIQAEIALAKGRLSQQDTSKTGSQDKRSKNATTNEPKERD